MRPPLDNALNRALAAILLVAAGLGAARCGQVLLTAPVGSRLRMEANPTFIEAHGGVSVISVAVVEPAGTVVPDGTVVQFFTTLGRIDEQGKTNDGVARVNLVATGLSGSATVTAISGGEAPSAPPTTSPSTTTPGSTTSTVATTTTTVRPGPGPNPPRQPQLGFAEGEGQAVMTVAIGSARPTQVVVTSDTVRITPQRPAAIAANVLDEFGNPVANVPVFFTLRAQTTTERLDSGGDPIFTDLNGRATDTLRTTAVATGTARSVTVDVTTANGISNNVVVGVN
jgi:hypothetical protein